MNNKLPKTYKLLSKNDFQNLRVESRFLVSGVLVFYTKENNLNYSRLGIAISKKIGSAVKRNLIKRKIREFYRKHEYKNKGIDILVALNFKKISSQKLDYKSVVALIDDSLSKAFSQ